MQESAELVTAIACWERLGLAKALSGTLESQSAATAWVDRQTRSSNKLLFCLLRARRHPRSNAACLPVSTEHLQPFATSERLVAGVGRGHAVSGWLERLKDHTRA